MAYDVTITTTDGAEYRRSFPTLDALDQFLEPLQYRSENGRLVLVSEDPLTAIYSTAIRTVGFSGFTAAEVQKRDLQRQHEAMAQRAAFANQIGAGAAIGGLADASPRFALSGVVR